MLVAGMAPQGEAIRAGMCSLEPPGCTAAVLARCCHRPPLTRALNAICCCSHRHHSHAATVVLALLPIEPMMMHAPQFFCLIVFHFCPTGITPNAATVVVLALLPMEPMMLHAPQRMFGPMVAAANAELQQYVAAQGSERLKFKGGLAGWGCECSAPC